MYVYIPLYDKVSIVCNQNYDISNNACHFTIIPKMYSH